MTANIPVLPIAGSAVLRASLALLALVTRWFKEFARARRHRREARALVGFDRHMLADIGISRSDVLDAISGPFWEDPTELLSERAGDRRRYRPRPMSRVTMTDTESGFRRPATNRPARLTV